MQVNWPGSIGGGAPIAMPRAGIDLRMASRKAALAFSMKWQRSATWVASGSVCATASP